MQDDRAWRDAVQLAREGRLDEALARIRLGEAELAPRQLLKAIRDTEPEVRPDMVLVASTPSGLPGIRPGRTTHQFMQDLIRSSRQQLILTSFVVQSGSAGLLRELRLAAERVEVAVAVNGDEVSLLTLKEHLGHARRLKVFVPDRSVWPRGVLHAKCLIVDGQRLFVTSANLTGHAADENLELGILVEGREAAEAHEIFRMLCASGHLAEISL